MVVSGIEGPPWLNLRCVDSTRPCKGWDVELVSSATPTAGNPRPGDETRGFDLALADGWIGRITTARREFAPEAAPEADRGGARV
jgi:hypothetical protein